MATMAIPTDGFAAQRTPCPRGGMHRSPGCACVIDEILGHCRALLAACREAELVLSADVGPDCGICNGEGGWDRSGETPTMTPVKHKPDCTLLVVRAAIARAEGR